MPIVSLPNGQEVEFPDSMSNDDISAAIQRNFPDLSPSGKDAGAPSALRDAVGKIKGMLFSDDSQKSVMDNYVQPAPDPTKLAGPDTGMLSEAGYAKIKQQEQEEPLDPRLLNVPNNGMVARAQVKAAREAQAGREQLENTLSSARVDKVRQEQEQAARDRIYTPENMAGNFAENARTAGNAVLKIGPTAAKGVFDLFRLASADTLGGPASQYFDNAMKVMDQTLAGEQFNAQNAGFKQVMSDPNADIGDMFVYLVDNPAILVDSGITTVGSMYLPAGAANYAAKGAKAVGLGIAATQKIATGATIATTMAQNAADTFTSDELAGASMGDRYKGAGISAAVTLLMGIATGGGAEGAIARKMAGDLQAGRVALSEAKDFLKAIGKEATQEGGEEIGGILGETIGSGNVPSMKNAAKRVAFASTLGAAMGGATHFTFGEGAGQNGVTDPQTQPPHERQEPTWADATAAPAAAPAPTIADIGKAGSIDEAIAAAQRVVASAGPATGADIDALEAAARGAAPKAELSVNPDGDGPLEVSGNTWRFGNQGYVPPSMSREDVIDLKGISAEDARVWSYGENKRDPGPVIDPNAMQGAGMLYSDPKQVTEAIERSRAEASQAARMQILDGLMETEGAANLNEKQLARAFSRALQQAGYNNPAPSDVELARIARMTGASAALAELDAPLPSAPNELVNAVPEKKAPPAVNDPLARIKKLVSDGYALQGKQLVKDGEKINLSRPEMLYARSLTRSNPEQEWTAFPDETGTLGVPRAEMPQIKAEHRGAMVNFLAARGITHEQVEVSGDELKPTQAEFSLSKVEKAKQFEGGDRSILISSDGHVLDGHHQWLAKADAGQPIKAIRLNAPIAELLPVVKDFPSAQQAEGATAPLQPARRRDTRTGGRRFRDQLKKENPFVAFLAEHGIDPADRPDAGVERGRAGNPPIPGYGPIFRRTGLRIDDLAEAARAAGFLTQADIDSDEDNGGVNKLFDMIRRALDGREVIQKAGNEPGVSKNDEDLLAEARRLGIDENQPIGAIYDAVMAAHAKLEAEREEIGAASVDEQEEIADLADQFTAEEAAYAADLLKDPPLEGGIPTNNLTDEEIDALFGLPTKAADGRQAEENPAGQAGESAEGTGPQGEVLEQYSREEVIARQQADEARKKQLEDERTKLEAKRKKEAEQKEIDARQQASAENFQLGQSAEDALAGQGDIFSQPAPKDNFDNWLNEGIEDKKRRNDEFHKRAQAAMQAEADENEDGFPLGIYGTADKPLLFASGLSAPKDYAQMFAAGGNVGISISELSNASIPKIAEAMVNAPRGSYLFVDSGAFSMFRANQKAKASGQIGFDDVFDEFEPGGKAIDFEKVLDRYQGLAEAIAKADGGGDAATARVFYVMPDIVGNQAESLELVKRYGETIEDYGINGILPLQSGDLTLTQAYEQAVRNLGFDPESYLSGIVGIPSAVEAASEAEFLDLMNRYGDKIMGVHILGAAQSEKLEARLAVLREAGYTDGNVSADANVLRSFLYGDTDRAEAMRKAAALTGAGKVFNEGTPEYDALQARHDALDKRIDALTDDQVRAVYGEIWKGTPKEGHAKTRDVEQLRGLIKNEHPDDTEAALAEIGKTPLQKEIDKAKGSKAAADPDKQDSRGLRQADRDLRDLTSAVTEFTLQTMAELEDDITPAEVVQGALQWAKDAGLNEGKFLRALHSEWMNERDDANLKELAPALLSPSQYIKPANDLDSMFDEVLAEETAPAAGIEGEKAKLKKQRKPKAIDAEKEKIKGQRTTGQAAASAAKNTAVGFAAAVQGLGELFGGAINPKSSIVPEFDQSKYEKAKPYFQAAVASFTDAAADIKEVMRAVIKAVLAQFGPETTANMKPYVVRFVQDWQDGNLEGESKNDADASGNSESDRADRGDGQPHVEENLFDAGPAAGRGTRNPGKNTDTAGRGSRRRTGVSGRAAADGGAQSNRGAGAKETGPDADAAGTEQSAGSSDRGSSGTQPDAGTDGGAASNAGTRLSIDDKRELQRKAEAVPVKPGNIANIRETLPMLLEGQQDDVLFAEQRFSNPDKAPGVMFTNGTGTGKTFTGLGIAKRFTKQGKNNGIIVVPNNEIAEAWIDAGKELMLDIKQLASTTDNGGKGIVITTFANFGDNASLVERNWDWAMLDEAHYLMASKDGNGTHALSTLRAITRHPDGFSAYSRRKNRDLYDKLAELKNSGGLQDEKGLWAELKKREDEQRPAFEAIANDKMARPKAIMLSATPFAYVKAIDYAEGYLFEFDREKSGSGYNSGDGREHFYMQHFGYRMRYNKLTRPDGAVDEGLMARQFNTWLKREGALSGRMLDVEADYDRKFIMVESALGRKIDEGIEFLREGDGEKFKPLVEPFMKQFDYLSRRFLLEAIKATEALPIIKGHLEKGRKVVVIHDYKKGRSFNPFSMRGISGDHFEWKDNKQVKIDLGELAQEFMARRPDLVRLKFPQHAALDILKGAFQNALIHNGDVPKKQLSANKKLFNAENFDHPVIILQADKGREGISLHDTTGKYMRVQVNIGLPSKPTALIQLEGRTYRVGQVTDAAFRYLNTGTNWERWTFAETIAERADTAEALAMGELARGLKDSIIEAFEDSAPHPITDEDGKGGKARDRSNAKIITEWDRAKSFYFGQSKKTSQTKAAEGKDYFATPEPVGFKMSEWADVRQGEDILEPSAGHGAIARWFPITANKTVIEPSTELQSRIRLVMEGHTRFVQSKFEDFDLVNKFDAIVMNPPFGIGGSDAIPHLAKAYRHLRDGGRIVALLPRGPAADKKFDAFMYGDKAPKDLFTVADINLPSVTFERAGTGVMTRIVILEKQADVEKAPNHSISRDYSSIEDINELFNKLEHLSIPGRQKADDAVTVAVEEAKAAPAEDAEPKRKKNLQAAADATGEERYFATFDFKHTKNNNDLFGAAVLNTLSREAYTRVNGIAKENGGWYNKFVGGGAKRGFVFNSADERAKFMREAGAVDEVAAGHDAQNALREDDAFRLDLPLSEQSYNVRQALRNEIKRLRAEAWQAGEQLADPDKADERMTGQQLLDRIAERLGNLADAVEYLQSLGVEDIKAGDAMYAAGEVNPTRRKLILAAAAAAAAPGAARADVTVGKAKPIDPTVLTQKVAPAIERILRQDFDGKGQLASGTTNPNGAQALKKAMNAIALTGPKELRALAGQVAKLLPDDGVWLTVDDKRRVNVHGVVELSPLVHMTLFTAEGRTGLTYETVIHEAMHVAVAAKYRSLGVGIVRENDSILNLKAPAAAAALEQFKEVWEEFRELTKGEDLGKATALGLAVSQARGNPDEFFVRSLTDPLLQAYMANKEYKGKTLWQRFKDWVKSSLFGFRKEGTAPSWLDAALAASGDLADAMAGDRSDWSRMAAISKQQASQRSAMHSAGRMQEETPEFKRWFGDSKVVDDNGNPLRVYHGTNRDFSQFNPDAHEGDFGSFFSDQISHSQEYARGDGGNVMPVYLSIKNPYEVTSRQWAAGEGLSPEEARDQGYDGYKITGLNGRGETTWVAFRPEQIKSAIGNNGNFDPSNPDIMARRVAPASTWDMPNSTMQEDVIHVLQDKHIDLKKAVSTIREAIGEFADKWNPYLQEELFHGRAATGVKEFLESELRPLLQDMQLRKITMEELEEYLHMRHAPERNEQVAKVNPNMPDGGSGVDTAVAEDYLMNLDPAKQRALEALAQRVDRINRKTQQILVDSGLESQATIDAWNAAYEFYVPLMREDMDLHVHGNGTGQGYSVRGPASKRAMGSKRAVIDILANVAMQRERAVVRAEKNKVDMALYGLALQAPNPEFWRPVNPERDPDLLEAELQRMGLSAAEIDAIMDEPTQRVIDRNTGLVTSRVNTLLRGADHVVAVRIDGKDRFIFFNERDERAMRMAHTLKNLHNDQLGMFLSRAAVITRWFSSINTQYNPIFGVVNLLRDTGEGAINLSATPIAGKQLDVMGEAGRLLKDVALKGFSLEKLTGADADLWRDFQRQGGVTGYRQMFSNSEERARAIEKELKKISAGKASKVGHAVFDWLSDYNEALENVTRMAAFKVARDNGLTDEQAASLAKNLTVNFNRKGRIGTQAGALYAFFNASVQGTARMAQTLAGPAGKKIIAGGIAFGVMQAVMMLAAGFDDEEPPEFVKAKNVVIPLGWITGKKNYLSFPMPLGFAIFPTIGRVIAEAVLRGEKPTKTIFKLVDATLDLFNPIGNAGMSVQTLTPTALDPLAALSENRDWTGKKIYREDMQSTHPTAGWTRTKDTATAWSKAIAYGLNYVTGGGKYGIGLVSPTPDQIDYLIGQATGGVGREVSKGAQTVSSLATGEELPPYKIPLAGRFYGNADSQSGVASKFYDNLKEINVLKEELKQREKAKDGVSEFRKANPALRQAEAMHEAESQLRELRQQKRDLIAKGASRDRIKLLEQKQTNIMRKANERIDAVKQKEPA